VLMSLRSIRSARAGLWSPRSLFGASFLHQSRAAILGTAFAATPGRQLMIPAFSGIIKNTSQLERSRFSIKRFGF
jgi:hypothetical protein